jgi:hypothetical protein
LDTVNLNKLPASRFRDVVNPSAVTRNRNGSKRDCGSQIAKKSCRPTTKKATCARARKTYQEIAAGKRNCAAETGEAGGELDGLVVIEEIKVDKCSLF